MKRIFESMDGADGWDYLLVGAVVWVGYFILLKAMDRRKKRP